MAALLTQYLVTEMDQTKDDPSDVYLSI